MSVDTGRGGLLSPRGPRPASRAADRLAAGPDPTSLAILILAVAVGAALVLLAAAMFIQVLR